MRNRLTIAVALLALAACNRQEQTDGNMTAEQVAEEMAGVTLEPGLWESTSEVVDVRATDLPAQVREMMLARGKTNVRNCITPEQAARPDANFLAAQQDSNCSYQDFAMNGGRMTGTMTCGGGDMPGQMRASMDGQYGPESYDMRMTMVTSGLPEGGDMTIETRTTGRRIGPCPEDEAAAE